jgi:curved DNA-binding protein CbpA
MPASDSPDLYAILNVGRRATQEQITRAYRALLRQHHPDTRPPGDASQRARSDDVLQQILSAYSVLGDRTSRAEYDRRVAGRARASAPQYRWRGKVPDRSQQQPAIVAGPVYWQPDVRWRAR